MFEIFGNITSANQTIHWHAQPLGRGTWGILQTCIITLILCVWTAVHLNLPDHEEADRPWAEPQVLTKIRWLMLGLLAPELVVFTAWHQFVKARESAGKITSILQENSPKKENKHWAVRLRHAILTFSRGPYPSETKDSENQNSRPPDIASNWSMQQAFFVNMGGIAIDPAEPSKPFLPKAIRKPVFINSEGVQFIARYYPELLRTITSRQIEDKSKRNGLAKAIVCLQASWFIAHCISRLAQKLPITLLELNTFGHCFCALLMYVLWWEKPFDVTEPILLRGQSAQQILAFFSMRTMLPGKMCSEWSYTTRKIENATKGDGQDVAVTLIPPRSDHEKDDHSSTAQEGQDAMADVELFEKAGVQHDHEALSIDETFCPKSDEAITFYSGDLMPGTGFRYKPGFTFLPSSITLSPVDQERWRLADAIFKDKTYLELGKGPILSWRRPKNWPSLNYYGREDWLIKVIMVLAGGIYGGLHALAWNAPFSTRTEQQLWQISASVIMCYGLIYVLALSLCRFAQRRLDSRLLTPGRYAYDFSTAFRYLLHPMSSFSRQSRSGLLGYGEPRTVLGKIFFIKFYITFALITLSYVLARLYLVIESFIALFYSPIGVFQQPVWANYFPHIG